MRRLFVFLMIVLLPLRAWAGDAMGVQMAASSAAVHVAGAMPADCPMLLAGLSAALSAAESAPDAKMVHPPGGMESCSSCELCVPLADLAPARFDVVGFSGHEQPLMGGVDFFSASPAPTFKPPIS